MAINFPDNPFNGQTTTFSGVTYTYNSTKNQWTANNPSTANISSSDNAPTSPSAGDLWFNSANGVMYIYYNDGSSSQWISISGYASSFDSASTISLIDSDYVQARQTTAASTTIVTDINGLIAISSPSNGDQAYVQSNNNLYFYDSGWYKIATVANDSPSSITGVNGSYALDISGGTTVITALSTDPEGFPLTWSYSTTGLGSIATISQANNVFTITPSTNTANTGSFTLTISVTDGVNGAVSTSSTLTLQFVVTNSKYTTRLVTATDTGDNNNITDASSNNHSITANGNATAGTFSPYRHGGYGVEFDGTGDYLTINDTNIANFGTNDFTIEAWIRCNDTTANQILETRPANTNGAYTTIIVEAGAGASFYTQSAELFPGRVGTINVNQWHHVAWVRNSGTISIYVDGTSVGSASNSTNFISSNVGIGWNAFLGENTGLVYISDYRIVKNTALYTSDFTPPTEKLTAVSGTSLLICQSNRFIDNSTNNHTITVNGNTKISTYVPYDNQEYSASDHGGSVYFDGAGSSYLEASLGNDGVFTGDFTFECWFNTATTSVGYQAILYQSGGSSANGVWGIDLGTGAQLRFFYGTSSSVANTSVASGITISTNIWYHVAVVRSGSTVTMYCNGISVSSFTNSDTSGSSSWGTTVGRNKYSSSRDFQGYIADVRLTSGTAVYTANFTPPTSPLSSSGAIFHVIGTDASIIDKAQGTNLIIPSSGVSGSTTQVKFASTKSIYFTGGSSAGVDLGTNLFLDALNTEYTLEMWYYPTQTGSQSFLMSSYISSSTGRWMLHQQADSRIRFFGNLNGTREIFTTAVSANNWYHVAVVRKSNGYMSIFLNGTETELAVDLNGYATVLDRPVLLGSGDTFNSGGCQGYIQDVRITKGLARYTSSFTPPTGELQG